MQPRLLPSDLSTKILTKIARFFWFSLFLGIAGISEASDCPASSLLVHNTRIYTVDEGRWTAQALAIRGDRIVFVGDERAAERWKCGAQRTLDLAGHVVYPGFTDGHQHLEGVGRRTRTLNLFGIDTLAATLRKIKAFAATTPPGDWVLGRGWIEREWTDEQRFLTRHDVDPFTEDKPLYLPRADGVSALVNTRALELAGIDRHTPDPPGGRFDRDEQGDLTGYVLATAMNPFLDILPEDTDAYLKENLRRGMIANAQMGWTQTHDAGMSWREVALLRELHAEGQMSHRVYIAVPVDESQRLIERGREQSDDGWFALRAIKVFIDGTLGSRGAALLEPYADADTSGFMNRTSRDTLMPVLEGALRSGLQVMTHVIGDRALRQTLDWYAESWDALPKEDWTTEDLRWRLEHAQIIPPEDQQRLVQMEILPSMQPSHGIGDLNFAPARLGAERLTYAYPWQPLLDRGIKIIAGSDAPVEVGDPRIEFYAAITRKRLDGTDDDGWHPEFAVSRADALRMLTLWPAYGAFQEKDRGSIAEGKFADLTVFDTDFLTSEPQSILGARTMLTVVGGKIVYERPRENQAITSARK